MTAPFLTWPAALARIPNAQENNYKTYLALHGSPSTSTSTSTAEANSSSDSSKMDTGDGGSGSKPKGFERMKGIIEEVCALEQFKEKRAAKMDQDDFLSLLAEFNKRGVHFTS